MRSRERCTFQKLSFYDKSGLQINEMYVSKVFVKIMTMIDFNFSASNLKKSKEVTSCLL